MVTQLLVFVEPWKAWCQSPRSQNTVIYIILPQALEFCKTTHSEKTHLSTSASRIWQNPPVRRCSGGVGEGLIASWCHPWLHGSSLLTVPLLPWRQSRCFWCYWGHLAHSHKGWTAHGGRAQRTQGVSSAEEAGTRKMSLPLWAWGLAMLCCHCSCRHDTGRKKVAGVLHVGRFPGWPPSVCGIPLQTEALTRLRGSQLRLFLCFYQEWILPVPGGVVYVFKAAHSHPVSLWSGIHNLTRPPFKYQRILGGNCLTSWMPVCMCN